jgi:hypothetical protein
MIFSKYVPMDLGNHHYGQEFVKCSDSYSFHIIAYPGYLYSTNASVSLDCPDVVTDMGILDSKNKQPVGFSYTLLLPDKRHSGTLLRARNQFSVVKSPEYSTVQPVQHDTL